MRVFSINNEKRIRLSTKQNFNTILIIAVLGIFAAVIFKKPKTARFYHWSSKTLVPPNVYDCNDHWVRV